MVYSSTAEPCLRWHVVPSSLPSSVLCLKLPTARSPHSPSIQISVSSPSFDATELLSLMSSCSFSSCLLQFAILINCNPYQSKLVVESILLSDFALTSCGKFSEILATRPEIFTRPGYITLICYCRLHFFMPPRFGTTSGVASVRRVPCESGY